MNADAVVNALNWFEIPVTNVERAMKFYNSVLGTDLKAFAFQPGFKMAQFPAKNGVGGPRLAGKAIPPV